MNQSIIRTTLILVIITILFQVAISVIYSNNIITQNYEFNQQRKQSDEIKRSVEKLQNQLSQLESISTILNSTPSANLKPIIKNLNLNE